MSQISLTFPDGNARDYPAADGRVRASFEFIHLAGWAPAPGQQRPLRPGSARTRLAAALGTAEHPLSGPGATTGTD